MKIKTTNPEKIVKNITLITLVVMVVWGAISVFAEVRPFWIDEWRIIYNLKTKSVEELWGKLAYMQQFPRTYLTGIKLFTEYFDYSYTSLRLPAYVVGLFTMVSIYLLCTAIFSANNLFRYLMVIMLVSSSTFTEYFVETKQYTMDLLMCTIAIWQLVWLLRLGRKQQIKPDLGYLLLCCSLIILPLFSYTYVIALLPVFAVLAIDNILSRKTNSSKQHGFVNLLLQWLPLFLVTFSITIFYIIDIKQLSTDNEMKHYWGHLMMNNGFAILEFAEHVFHLFAQAGAGLLFWSLFGVSCTASFFYCIRKCYLNVKASTHTIQDSAVLYSVLLILLIMVLNIMGKLPIGEPRLNAFAIPAIAVMLVTMLTDIAKMKKYKKTAQITFFILFAGPVGNVYSTIAACFTDSKYAQRMEIYHATQAALNRANIEQMPIFITPGVAYPYENTVNFPFDNNVPGDWVLMTFPAYKMGHSGLVFAINDTTNTKDYVERIPENTDSLMIGDGINYKFISRNNRNQE
jgi:hypothetical protein